MYTNDKYKSILSISYFKLFWMLILIILLPLLMHAKLLIEGIKTDGEVVDYGSNTTKMGRGMGTSTYSVISFNAGDQVYYIKGANNVDIELGEKVKVIYSEDNPGNNAIYSLSYFYFSAGSVLPAFLLIIWISLFHTVYQEKAKKSCAVD